MESLDTSAACFMDDLLDFSSDIGEEGEDDDECEKTKIPRTCSSSFSLLPPRPSKNTPPFAIQEFVEEELEWISNKDAFPMVESFVDIMPNHPSINTTTTTTTSSATTTSSHRSPVSVLENSSSSMNSGGSHGSSRRSTATTATATAISALKSTFKVPGKARTKQLRKRRQDMLGQQWQCWAQHPEKGKAHKPVKPSSTIGRKCLHCQAEKTPQWRAGPLGPKTLCNACGVRYKSGRLVPEYRPVSSPTFSTELHSNSHRKIVEMRRQKLVVTDIGMKNPEIVTSGGSNRWHGIRRTLVGL